MKGLLVYHGTGVQTAGLDTSYIPMVPCSHMDLKPAPVTGSLPELHLRKGALLDQKQAAGDHQETL